MDLKPQDLLVLLKVAAHPAQRGFARDVTSDVICRWVHQASGLVFDLMPVQPEVLGFTNRWYDHAVQTATPMDLGDGITTGAPNQPV